MTPDRAIGVYLHVPFCSHICHYCDFAKTARYSQEQVEAYFAAIGQQLQAALACLPGEVGVDSVFIGGGTPSLFTHQFEPWLEQLRPRLTSSLQKVKSASDATREAEVTIEVNPLHATKANIAAWLAMGINRISLGVQSFDDEQLALLTRQHRRKQAIAAAEQAKADCANVSIDLIYGLPGGSGWRDSLEVAIATGADHLSLYTLTYEGNTVFNRRKKRQLVQERKDDELEGLYSQAMAKMAEAGYDHYEVSNWARPSFASRHNQKYWQMKDYLALGTGAHGFLADSLLARADSLLAGQAGAGRRYSFSRKLPTPQALEASLAEGQEAGLESALVAMGAAFEEGRSLDDYLTEAVLSAVRTARGVPIAALERRLGLAFTPPPLISKGLGDGLMSSKDGYLVFSPKEWYREYGWVHQVLAGFTPAAPEG